MIKMRLNEWIFEKTEKSKVVVELGAGFFRNLSFVSSSVKKIGIEIWEPYINNAVFHECKKIHGDIRNFDKLLNKEDIDCALICDVLEHFKKEEAITLIKKIMFSFNKTLLMIPEGIHIQNYDTTGFGADEYQSHKSTWYFDDIVSLGFDEVELDPYFHTNMPNKGCIFAEYNHSGKVIDVL